MPRVRVLIADDHRLFAEALEAILGSDERIEVIARDADGSEALELAREHRHDVVLMNRSMPVSDGFDASRVIAAEVDGARVLVLTVSAASADIAVAREA